MDRKASNAPKSLGNGSGGWKGKKLESENKLAKGGQQENKGNGNTIFNYFKKKRSATEAELDDSSTPLPLPLTGTETSVSQSKVLTILGSSKSTLGFAGPLPSTSTAVNNDDEVIFVADVNIISTQPVISPSVATGDDSPDDDPAADVDGSRSPTPLREGEYEVEEIMDYDHHSEGDLYLIKWKGYSEDDNTWEPLANLSLCEDKLVDFFLARRNQNEQIDLSSTGDKRRKSGKFILPPDPRRLRVIVEEFFNREDVQEPSTEEINVTYKNLLSGSSRWSEVKLKKKLASASTLKLDKNKWDELRSQAIFCSAEAAGEDMKENLKDWENSMNRITCGMPIILTENDVDLSGRPADFIYINDYQPEQGIIIPEDPPMGCSCADNCAGSKSRCCPKELGSYHRGFYTAQKRMQAEPGIPIYECNKMCKCSADCSNRVVQDGILPLKDKKFIIFQTPHCGWGVKSPKIIKKGSFVCMYVGEIISDAEANRRGKLYDQEGSTYLFDLDFNQTDGDDCPYVVDAKKFGNIAHFFNHSCDPNLTVYGVWSNCLDINLPKLALFAVRDIPIGTELTFDYTRSQERRNEADPADLPPIKTKECRCGSAKCRKFLF